MKKILLFIGMFLFIFNVKALTFNVNLTNIEDKGNNGTIGSIEKIDIPNKTLDVLFQDIGDEVSFDLTITNSGNRAGTLKSISVESTSESIEYTNNLPEGGLSINGYDFNTVTITAKVKEGAVNGKTSSEITIKYNYDEGSCPEGEILSSDESMCLCPEGLERNENGICVKPEKEVINCEDDEIYNETKKICEKKVVPTPNKTINPSNPKTMDNIILITLLFIVSGLGIYAVMFKKLKTKKKKITAGVITGVVTLTLSFTTLAGVFGLDNLLSAIINPITKSKEIIIKVNEEIELIETWDGECELEVAQLTPENIFEGGSGTEDDPYQIKTAEQLGCFAKSINNGTLYQGQYVKQTKNIKLNDNLNNKISNNTTNGLHPWTTAGHTDYSHDEDWNWTRLTLGFQGTYDGDNHIISGLYITDDSQIVSPVQNWETYIGMFGFAMNATFKNMILSDVYYNTTYPTGTLVGYGYENLTLDNITTYGNVTGSSIAGVFAYYNGNKVGSLVIENTTNNIDMTCNGSCAGILNKVESNEECFDTSVEYNLILKNVTNNGNLTYTGSPSGTGGIIGYNYSGTTKALIENVVNNGDLTFTNGANGGGVGGLFGYLYGEKIIIKNSHNIGNITGFSSLGYVGGIASGMGNYKELSIENTWNSGQITSILTTEEGKQYSNKHSYAAGLIGAAFEERQYSGTTFTMKNCYNTGNIHTPADQYAAGLVSDGEADTALIENCYNTGNIDGGAYPGGLIGEFYNSTIKNSYNSGNVLANNNMVAGLVGYGCSDIYNSYNKGKITLNGSGSYVGGLCTYGSNIIKNSYNTGDLEIVGYSEMTGGLIASGGIISNSYNSGNITMGTPLVSMYVGGLSGTNGTITDSYNIGNITLERNVPYLCAGGIEGGGGTTSNSVNIGNVSLILKEPYTSDATLLMGGISATGSAVNSFNAGTILIDETEHSITGDGFNHSIAVGEILGQANSNSSGNKFNTKPNGKTLGCTEATGWVACTEDQSEAVGAYTNEATPDILSIINGDDAFEIKEGDTLPTLKIFNN